MTISKTTISEQDYLIQECLIHTALLPKFIALNSSDKECTQFLENCKLSQLSLTYALKNHFATFLKSFLSFSQTDANGFTHRGEMFVISPFQLETLFPGVCFPKINSLLDVGAGDGGITQRFLQSLPNLSTVTVTETSFYMKKRLSHLNLPNNADLNVFSPEEMENSRSTYDLILCFNVLDRCSEPSKLLKQMKQKLNDEKSTLVLAVVFPWCPFVESNASQEKPQEILNCMEGFSCKNGASFETSCSRFIVEYLLPIGFELISWSRVPYLCQGDSNAPYYSLSDCIMVLQRKD
eukprot:snap_masked-scaffold_38-processed-gene-1.39-mRNA-1 protein AED:0.06 eAED:0.06 QI:0/-1/0/1/-1/1/1/0/293